MIAPYYQDDSATIYHGKCQEILPLLPHTDLVLTDPPYGTEGGRGNNAKKKKGVYLDGFSDTPAYVHDIVVPVIKSLVENCLRVVITPGNKHAHLYPQPNDIGAFYHPASSTWTPWGVLSLTLIFYYGCPPRHNGKMGATSKLVNEAAPKLGHPCSKPTKAWTWLLDRCSAPQDLILDPFMGSGTTLRVAKDLGRRAIGIEIEEKYCEIAAIRMQQEVLSL